MNLQSQLEGFEGRRNAAYPDPLTGGDPWTIGIGHTGPEVHEHLVWSDELIDKTFADDVAKARQGIVAVIPWFDRLNEPRQAVLIGMAFQLGVKGVLGFNRTLGAIRDERYADAATGMKNSLWAKQTPRRANILARQMESGAWES